MHRAIAPVGGATNDFDIFSALARRLGYENEFTAGRDEMAWCQWVYDQVRASATAKGVALPGFQQFWAEGFVELPPPERDYVLFEDFRRDPERHPLKTPSGRIEIVSDAVAGFEYADCPPHPAWIPPAEWLGSAVAERWPLHLVTHQPASRLHSQMDPGPVSVGQKIAGREPIRISPPDAAKRGIRDGDLVRVFNSRGPALPARPSTPASSPGVVVMATGARFDPSDASRRA
jgi:biotin/methionine sulfoxide reductase